MKQLFFYFLVFGFLTLSLNSCKQKTSNEISQDNDTVSVYQEETPPMNYGDEGPVFVNEAGEEVIKILSEGNEMLTLKALSEDKIYELSQVVTASGVKYEDADGYFFWSKSEDAFFGQKETTIYDNLKLKK